MVVFSPDFSQVAKYADEWIPLNAGQDGAWWMAVDHVILREFRDRWATMDSVLLNNTVAEIWNAHPDSSDLWSHCAIVPLYVTFMSIAGIRPSAPGFAQCTIPPQPADLRQLELTLRTIRGDIRFTSSGLRGDRELTLEVPSNVRATLLLDPREAVSLDSGQESPTMEHQAYVLPLPSFGTLPGGSTHFALGFTGNGVAPCHLAGRVLAGLALDVVDDVTTLSFVGHRPKPFPRGPIFVSGERIVTHAVLRRDEREDRGRPAGRTIDTFARLPRRLGYNLGP